MLTIQQLKQRQAKEKLILTKLAIARLDLAKMGNISIKQVRLHLKAQGLN